MEGVRPRVCPLGDPLLPPPHQYLHSFVDIFSMLVLKSSLGQIDGEHTGHPHEPCHTSIDEFGCDTTPWEGRRPRVKEGGWLQRAYTVRTGREWGEEGRRAETERSKGRHATQGTSAPSCPGPAPQPPTLTPAAPLAALCASLPRSSSRDRLGARSQEGLATSFRGTALPGPKHLALIIFLKASGHPA